MHTEMNDCAENGLIARANLNFRENYRGYIPGDEELDVQTRNPDSEHSIVS